MPYQLLMNGKLFHMLMSCIWIADSLPKHHRHDGLTDCFFLATAALNRMFTMADIQGGAAFPQPSTHPSKHTTPVSACVLSSKTSFCMQQPSGTVGVLLHFFYEINHWYYAGNYFYNFWQQSGSFKM